MQSTSELEESPNICEFVLKQWQDRFENYSTFVREMNWMIKKVNRELLKEPNEQLQVLVEELVFILSFGTKQMIDDFCNQPEAA